LCRLISELPEGVVDSRITENRTTVGGQGNLHQGNLSMSLHRFVAIVDGLPG
jgi:hypothetical protein